MNHKLPIAAIFLLLYLPFQLNGQTASELGLVLTGEHLADDKIIETGDDIIVRCGVRMTFENKGIEPVIIINPRLGYGTGLKEVRIFLKSRAKGGQSLLKVIDPDPLEVRNFNSMAEYFVDEKPPENMTVVLNPGDRFPFEQFFYLELSLFKVDMPKSLQHQPAYFRRFPGALQLTYEFSFLKNSNDPDLLENMSVKWRKYGRLPVSPSGTYTITSEKFQ